METAWDKKLTRCEGQLCGHCGACHAAAYNERMFGLSPLDRPGTEEYFNAVMASNRRKAESRSRFAVSTPKAKRFPVRVARAEEGTISAQRCDTCDRMLSTGERALAAVDSPAVAHVGCAFTVSEINGEYFAVRCSGTRTKVAYVVVGE